MNKILLIISILFISFTPSYAQKVVNIQECQQWAIAQTSSNVQKELNEQLLKVKLNDAVSHLYPKLEINGLASYQSQVPQLPIDGADMISRDQYRVSMELYQTIFDGGTFVYNRKYERMLNQSEIDKLDISINQIKEQVINLYLNLLIIEKQITILSSVENTLEEQLDQLNILLKEGVIYGNMIAHLELEGLKIEQQKGQLEASKESMISSLSILTGKDLKDATFIVPEVENVEENTNSERLEFAIFDNTIAGLEYQRKLHYASTMPKLKLIAVGGYGRTTFDIFSNNFDWFYFVGLQLNIPLIDWARTAGVGNIINLQKSILQAQESDFEKSNKIAIQEKLNDIRRIEKLLILDNQIAERYKGLTKTLQTQLMNGTITAFDYIKQQNDEIQSLINQEVHSIQLLKAKYELLALKGKL